MLDKVRMKKVHNQSFGRNHNISSKSQSMGASKKIRASGASIKSIKELQNLPRNPSRGSSTSFNNVDYNFHGNFNEIHHLI